VNVLPVVDRPAPPLAEWLRPSMLDALAIHDMGSVYRMLGKIGYSQHHIADLTRQKQPEISAIMKGRLVSAYDVFARVARGLEIPPCLVGLSFGDCDNGCRIHPRAQDNQERYLAYLAGAR
jgi:hypothetical protein